MRWFRFAVLVSLATVLQAGFLANLSIKPDLLLIVLVFLAIHSNTADAIITSFTIGFAADLIGRTMGPQMISFGLFGTLLAYLRRVLAIRKMPYQGLAIFVTALLAGVCASFGFADGRAGRTKFVWCHLRDSAMLRYRGPVFILADGLVDAYKDKPLRPARDSQIVGRASKDESQDIRCNVRQANQNLYNYQRAVPGGLLAPPGTDATADGVLRPA